MPDSELTVASFASYRNQAAYPFCPGCGHGGILDALNAALVRLQADPRRTVIVSDIGCVGLSDQYLELNAFHGLHGRSIAYATGIKLARPELDVIVLIGDGGCGIGGAHLLSAARRNIGVTVLVFNNLNFGMTGGQHSATTPLESVTSTTPPGNLERPLDLCATVGVNGAAYAYRGSVFDKDLPERIAEAIACPGFALLDIWELCTAYFVPNNRFSRKALLATLEGLGFGTGVLHRVSRPEYAEALRAQAEGSRVPAGEPRLTPRFASALERPFGVVLAGSAGGKVRSAARLAGHAALLSGLYAAQRDDYPVTVKTGHSLSELMLSPRPIEHAGIGAPDAVVVVSPDGLRKSDRHVSAQAADGAVYALPRLVPAAAGGRRFVLDPEACGVVLGRSDAALALLSAALLREGVLLPEALLEAASLEPGERAAASRKAVESGLRLARSA